MSSIQTLTANQVYKNIEHRFEIRKSDVPGLFEIVASGSDVVLSMGTTEEFALQNFEQSAVRFIRYVQEKANASIVTNDRGSSDDKHFSKEGAQS